MAGRDLVVNLIGDATKFTKTLKDAGDETSKFGDKAKGHLSGVGDAVGKMAKTAAFVGIPALVGFGVAAVKAFADAEQVAAQTNAVLKSTGGIARVSAADVDKLSASLSMLSGVDDEVIASGENMLLTFTEVRNGVGKGNDIFNQATKAALDYSVATGTNMVEASKMMGKALNDPVKGLAALTKAGVTFTDQQKEAIKSMVAHGDTAGAQKIILAEFNKEFGGSAAAAGDTFAGSLNKLKVILGNFMETVGSKLVPILVTVANLFADNIPAAMAVVGPIFETIKDAAWLFVDAIEHGDVAAGGFAGKISDFGSAIHDAIPIVKDIVGNALSLLSNWWDHWGPMIQDLAYDVGQGLVRLKDIAVSAANFIVDNWDKIGPVLKLIAGIIAVVMIPHFILLKVEAGVAAAKVAAAWVVTQAQAFAAAAAHVLQVGIMVAKWVWMGVQALASAAQVAAAWLISLGPIALVVAAVVGAVALIVKNWDTIKEAAAKVWDWISTNWPLILTVLTGPIGLAVRAIVTHWDTIKGGFTAVKDWIGARIADVVGFFTGMPGRISAVTGGLFNGIKDAFKGAINWVINAWNNLHFGLPSISVFGKEIGGQSFGTPYIKPLAMGGDFNGIALVGEKGPELLSGKGHITPNNKLGGGNTYNITVQTLDSQSAGQVVVDAISAYERSNGNSWRAA